MELVGVPVRDKRLGTTFSERFAPDRSQDWSRGFALARDLGAAAQPLLMELASRADSDARRRLLLVGAAALAGGEGADAYLLGLLARGRGGVDGIRDRFLVCFLLALGVERAERAPALEALAQRSGLEPIEETAVALALARFGPGVEVPPAWYRSAEPSVVAAAAFAHPPQDPRRLAPWWERDLRGASLVRRGELLGRAPAPYDRTRAAALAAVLARRGEDAEGVRSAAALWLSRVPDPDVWLDRGDLPLDADLVPLLAAEPGFRSALARRDLLEPPPARMSAELRGRTALAFALETGRASLERTADAWRRDADAARALCLGVAWRFLRDPAAAHADWIGLLPDVREAEWVRFACGIAPQDATRPMDDPALDRAFDAAVTAGSPRVDRPAAAAAIEDALWRAGAHLGLSRREVELDFARDLLLAGSTHGAAVLGVTDQRERNLPRGLSAGDDTFEIAFELYRFVRKPARRAPGAARLR